MGLLLYYKDIMHSDFSKHVAHDWSITTLKQQDNSNLNIKKVFIKRWSLLEGGLIKRWP